MTEEAIDPFGKEMHDKHCPEHSGNKGHFCGDWDGLWICEDCEEFKCCWCGLEDEK